jgi:hypothetical protein
MPDISTGYDRDFTRVIFPGLGGLYTLETSGQYNYYLV